MLSFKPTNREVLIFQNHDVLAADVLGKALASNCGTICWQLIVQLSQPTINSTGSSREFNLVSKDGMESNTTNDTSTLQLISAVLLAIEISVVKENNGKNVERNK